MHLEAPMDVTGNQLDHVIRNYRAARLGFLQLLAIATGALAILVCWFFVWKNLQIPLLLHIPLMGVFVNYLVTIGRILTVKEYLQKNVRGFALQISPDEKTEGRFCFRIVVNNYHMVPETAPYVRIALNGFKYSEIRAARAWNQPRHLNIDWEIRGCNFHPLPEEFRVRVRDPERNEVDLSLPNLFRCMEIIHREDIRNFGDLLFHALPNASAKQRDLTN